MGQPKYRGRDYSLYKCPLHGEQKGYSLAVYADHWQCFGKCNRGGDAIAWLREYHNLSFQDACQRLASGDLPRTDGQQQRPAKMQPISEPPDAAWQKPAAQISGLSQAARCVQVPQGKDVNDFYLQQGHRAMHDWLQHLLVARA